MLTLAGTSVRLRSREGGEQVVLASHLLASPGCGVSGHDETAGEATGLEPFGLLEALPQAALEAARMWELHVVEVETGFLPDSAPGTEPRAGATARPRR